MKNTKKVLLACLFAMLAMGMVFAGGPPEEMDDVVLSVMAYGDNSTAEGQSLVRIVEAFEAANPGITVDMEVLFDEPYHQKVIARLASGDVPDVAYMGSDARWGASWMEAGQQADITDYIDTKMYDLTLFGSPHNVDGSYYYIPVGTNNITSVVFANLNALDALGLEIPTTYEEMVDMVAVANAAGVEVLGASGAAAWVWGSCIFGNIVAQMTGDANWPSKAAAGEVDYTDPDFIASLEFLEMMVADGVISSESILVEGGTGWSKFNAGEYLFYVGGMWDAANISLENKESVELIAFPAMPGNKGLVGSVSAAPTPGYGITTAGMDRGVAEAAMKFINFFNSEAEVTQRLRDGGIIYPVLKDYDAPTDLDPIVLAKMELAASVTSTTEVLDAFITGDALNAIQTGLQEIVNGSKTPAEVAAEAQSHVMM